MSDYINGFEMILKKAVEFYQQPEEFVFPDSEKLKDTYKINPPDLTGLFQDGIDIYCSMEKNTPKSRKLIHAAVCLDIAYEVPPSEIRKAVIKMLILCGNYEAACCYALEYLTVSEVQRLMFEHMPLSRDGSYHISHLMLPCWEPEAELAVIMRELRKSNQEERKSLILSLLYSQGELKDKPQSLLEAVCAFLYIEICKEKTEEQIKNINKQIKGREYIEIVEILLQYCYSSVNADYYQVSRSESCPEWDSRWEKFNQYYSDKLKKGFFIYHPGMRGAVVMHIRLGSAYELSETETALAGTDLHISLNQNLILKVDYTKHRGKLRLLAPEDIKFDEMGKIAERLRVLIKIGGSKELKRYYRTFINCYEIQSTLESAKQYKLFAGDMEKLLNIFNRYTQIKWHNQKHALEMMQFLLKRGEGGLLDKNYIALFNYFMRIKAYDLAEKFLEQYEDELGKKYYLQALVQLQNFNPRNSKGSNIFLQRPMVKTSWHPLQLGEGYGNYVTCFLKKGEELLAKRQGNPDFMNEKELREEHDRIIQLGDERSENPVEAAEYFLMAGAVLNKHRERFLCIDMNEMFAEDMIDAFYHYSRNEMNQLNIDHDVMHSYQEQALHLIGQLHPDYLNNTLKNMFEEMLKRYFKERLGHDNGSLSEAVKYMAQTKTVTDEEFGSCLMRLSLYYPDFLMRTDITKLLQTNEEVKRRLTVYMQFLEWIPNTDVEMSVVLQEYRNQLVEEFNNCDFIRRIDNSEEQKEEIKKGYTQLQDFKGRKKLYGILSKSDHGYVEELMELLKNLPKDGASYIAIRKYKKECTCLCEEIEQRPTSFAVEHLYAFAQILEEYSEQRRRVLCEKLTPVFSADVLFAESNLQGNDGIRIYLQMKCSGGSGLRDVTVRVFGSENVLEGGEYGICSYVEENGKEYGFFPIQLAQPEIVQESLSFKVEFKFMIEKTREKKSSIVEFDVTMENLALSENYEQMYNPGSALYEGHTMAEYTFCGRNSLIERICRRFYDFPNSMVVLYGQRKVGKTTIANYVASSIKKSGKKILVVNCGNSNITLYNKEIKDCTKEIVQDFYANILKYIASEIERDNRYGGCLQNVIIEMKEAADKENRMNVVRTFSGLIRRLHDAFEREECWRGTHILLWFDEFQRYYLSILEGRLQPEFVGFLKAFIEQYNFSFLLVGCEPMIPFIQDIKFGNTFSAAEQIYVEYLPMEYAKNLICDPIPRKSGRENPFRFVVDEIYRLSSGSPYFIQLICRNLIDDLNEKKKVFADKEMILDSLHKEGKVKQNNFDSLFASLNFQAASPEDNNRVLKRIAYRQKERTGSTRKKIISDLENITEKPTETVLDELLSRKIIEESDGELRIVVRLYEEWIWENRIELGYDELPEL